MISVVDENIAPGHAAGDSQGHPPCVVVHAPTDAPHSSSNLTLKFHPKAGAQYALWYRVGGGGGHSLTISDIRPFILEFSREPSVFGQFDEDTSFFRGYEEYHIRGSEEDLEIEGNLLDDD